MSDRRRMCLPPVAAERKSGQISAQGALPPVSCGAPPRDMSKRKMQKWRIL